MLESLGELLSTLWALVTVSLGLVWGVVHHLHVGAPRLEGLLVGVLLTWLLLRREKHPLLRVLSSPLKLVLDILDLAWDQCTEIVGDLWGVAVGWLRGLAAWPVGKATAAWSWMMEKLRGVKGKLE